VFAICQRVDLRIVEDELAVLFLLVALRDDAGFTTARLDLGCGKRGLFLRVFDRVVLFHVRGAIAVSGRFGAFYLERIGRPFCGV